MEKDEMAVARTCSRVEAKKKKKRGNKAFRGPARAKRRRGGVINVWERL